MTINTTADDKTAYRPILRGRRKIYTDEWEVNESNVIRVLQLTMMWHEQNAQEMRFLLDYEKGFQPLRRNKLVRSEVNVEAIDNIANQVVVFKQGYIWGNPILYIQRGNKDLSGSDEEGNEQQDLGITMLNEMNEIEFAQTKDQELARYVEICGVGYQMIDIRPKYDGLSAFDLMTLNPLFTYCVYRNNARQDKVCGVTFHRDIYSGDTWYSVFTPKKRFEIRNMTQMVDEYGNKEKVDKWEIQKDPVTGLSYYINPFETIPIVEFNRAADRTGCFERQIPDMDALNIESSDFVNLFCQSVQEIWWGVDFELPIDPETRKPKKAKNGQWIITKSINGGKPDLKPLHSDIDFDGIQRNIESRRELILQKCYVPLQSEPGGGSTGTAMSMSSGWAAAESAAAMEEQMLFRGKMEIVQLEIMAISKITGIEANSPLLKLKPSDVKPQFTRNKTYDLVSKVNAMVTMIKSGVHGRTAMETVNLFPDVAQAWADSKEVIEKYQTAIINRADNTYVSAYTKNKDSEASGDKAGADETDQIVNSPIVNTYPGGQERTTAMRNESRVGSDVL